jgi:D-threonate/D-erythronate kinase
VTVDAPPLRLHAVADDVTGACDVAAELAQAGFRVRVAVTPARSSATAGDGIVVANTQSRSLPVADAAARVRAAVGSVRCDLLLKKIDTALRGHLGGELEAAIDAAGARAAFVLAAIPAAGRVTRDGVQFLDGVPLGATEFARDPEGAGAESSIAAVIARESRRPLASLGLAEVRGADLASRMRALLDQGAAIVVVDAEHDDDLARAVAAILTLDGPLCVAGSIALTAAVAATLPPPTATPRRALSDPLPGPVLIVNGSLHGRARAQVDLLGRDAGAIALAVGGDGATIAERAWQHLRRGTPVVLAPSPVHAVPAGPALRATEQALAAAAAAVARRDRVGALVLIGGETSHAVLAALEVGVLAIDGRVAPLVARGEMLDGAAAGAALVIKGGSGGAADVLVPIVRPPALHAGAAR